VLAGAERFFIEFFRAKDDRFAMGMTLAQVIALVLVSAGVLIMMRTRRAAASTTPRSSIA